MALLLGIDLGGTNCRAALADAEGEILAEASEPVADSDAGGQNLVAQIRRLLAKTRSLAGERGRGQLAAVGAGVPGFVDTERGTTRVLPNLAGGAHELALRDLVAEGLGAPTAVENDVKTAAVGELARGWGKAGQFADFIFVGMGTGISAAVVIGGRLYRGAGGQAGEIAYTVTGREFLGQDFGEHGCLETFASGYGIAHRYAQRTGRRGASAQAVFAASDRGDDDARAVIADAFEHWTVALSAAVALLAPQAIILGGGIGTRPDVVAELGARLRSTLPLFQPEVLASMLGANAQIVGAIELARSLRAGREVSPRP
jgi:glucokinase